MFRRDEARDGDRVRDHVEDGTVLPPGEDTQRRYEKVVAEVERFTDRTFSEVPPLYIWDNPENTSRFLAVEYAPGIELPFRGRTFGVSLPVFERAYDWAVLLDSERGVNEWTMAHELTHALQYQEQFDPHPPSFRETADSSLHALKPGATDGTPVVDRLHAEGFGYWVADRLYEEAEREGTGPGPVHAVGRQWFRHHEAVYGEEETLEHGFAPPPDEAYIRATVDRSPISDTSVEQLLDLEKETSGFAEAVY